jgi:hypothetical protein
MVLGAWAIARATGHWEMALPAEVLVPACWVASLPSHWTWPPVVRARPDADRLGNGGAGMNRTKALLAALYSAALSLWVLPALALAQATTPPAPSPPQSTPGAGTSGGGAGWLWIIAAIVVLAIIWWAMSSRRRGGTVTR